MENTVPGNNTGFTSVDAFDFLIPDQGPPPLAGFENAFMNTWSNNLHLSSHESGPSAADLYLQGSWDAFTNIDGLLG